MIYPSEQYNDFRLVKRSPPRATLSMLSMPSRGQIPQWLFGPFASAAEVVLLLQRSYTRRENVLRFAEKVFSHSINRERRDQAIMIAISLQHKWGRSQVFFFVLTWLCICVEISNLATDSWSVTHWFINTFDMQKEWKKVPAFDPACLTLGSKKKLPRTMNWIEIKEGKECIYFSQIHAMNWWYGF